MSEDATLRMEELRKIIKKHNVAYYEKDEPTISDAEWDSLMRELKGLERQFPDAKPADSPTETIGGATSKIFAPVTHSVPMMSLDNAFEISELEQWTQKAQRKLDTEDAISELVCELKGVLGPKTVASGQVNEVLSLVASAEEHDGAFGRTVDQDGVQLLLSGMRPQLVGGGLQHRVDAFSRGFAPFSFQYLNVQGGLGRDGQRLVGNSRERAREEDGEEEISHGAFIVGLPLSQPRERRNLSISKTVFS